MLLSVTIQPRVMLNAKTSICVTVGKTKLGGCIALTEHNTVFASNRSAICNRCFPGPIKRHLGHFSRFFPGSLGDRPTDRPTDHATRSVTIDGVHSGEAKFCYCLRLQQVGLFIGAVDSTDRINFSNQQLHSAVRLDGLQCKCNIASKRAVSTGVLDR